MGRDRQQRANKERQKRNSKTVAGKTSLSDLVSAGLLQAGATVVCNSWPFTATVSAAGRLDAQWTVPSDFAQPLAGAEFMRAEFDTPSAWATAVCRVMRAQTRSNGESRVAVNGWTACRIQMPSESGSDEPTEISLDALRREFTARHAADSDESTSNAVDGLAQQVAQSLALGCVSQRRAAAAATTAMAPGRKRKSIPDMARHAKLSRVPTADSSDAEVDDALVRLALDAYQAAADAYPRDERKAVGARRRQTLRQAIVAAADAWLSARHLRRSLVPRTVEPGVSATLVPQSTAVLPRLCVACGSAGTAALHSCHVCGDGYHGFCVPTSSAAAADRRFVCPACSVCATCLVADPADLRACDACGLSTHARCSWQQADKPNSGSSTRWLCDGCVRCLECGFTMDSDVSDWDTRVSWAYDSCVCGHCAAQIGRGRVCPECVSTYADAASASTMVCCDVCALWVHSACDPSLTPPVYGALITREDAAYVCPTCVQPPESPTDCLPQCLRVVSCFREPAPSLNRLSPLLEISVKPEIETEAANLLLSLTQSDIRFDYERFTLDRLQSRFCLSTGDSRSCALCGLLGDGFSGTQQLGRLIPFGSSNSMPAPLWAHVECLAWAWGPRSVEADGMVRFEGTLMDADPNASPQNCTLCTRSGPTFHCCAPVPCPDSAFHLPCLLAAATLPSAWEIQYSAAWRRALCSTHAPKYSAMMPMDDPTVQPLSLANICVKSQVAYASTDTTDHFTRIGNLVVLSWGSVSDTGTPVVVDDLCFPSDGFYIVRYLYVADTCYTLGLQTVSSTWRGWISPMPLALSAVPATEMTLDTISDYQLSDLLAQLLRQHPIDQFLVDLAIAHPLRFLGLDRYQSAFLSLLDCNVHGYERLLLSESAISIPTNTLLHSHNSPTLNDSTIN